ncbi:MAG TPA: hypothetical protein VNX68_17060 [Nitrosopumilaceae archaeon]|jgi:hypothetical protein|nr:hypothetical protein [Nitrosopumilaceae archaeon]
MNQMLVPPSINQLRIRLHCLNIAIRLSANNYIDFLEADGDPQAMLWCGHGFLPDVLEPDACWEPVDFSEMPLLAALYHKFGEAGLYFWAAWKRDACLTVLQPMVRKIYSQALEFTMNYLTDGNIGQLH